VNKMKIIVNNESDRLTDADCLWYVQQVINEGRISDNGKSYCYCMNFKTGIVVYATKNKTSDTFRVCDSK